MVSVRRRLENLEASAQKAQPYKTPRHVERYFHALENARRELEGREQLPELEYTKEDYEDDLDFLEHTIPSTRRNPGWQGEDAQTLLDQWERRTREKIADYERNKA